MVSLPLMARLLEAVRSDARLVLVGDPFQLASIEAGTVLADLVGPVDQTVGGGVLSGRVTVLRQMHRFGADSSIASLAESVRTGDADAALDVLRSGGNEVSWVVDTDAVAIDRVRAQVVETGLEVVDAARRGDAVAALRAAGTIKVLTGTRHGTLGLYDWTDRIAADVERRSPERRRSGRWSVGRPVIVTANDRVNRVANGDVGVVVDVDGQMMVAFLEPDGVRRLAPSRLDQAETWWAMTIHKSQGSEFDHAVVVLPEARSPVLTRELLYTAVTRAKHRLTVISSEASLRAAIDRPVARASGLRDRLWPT
jgi:exodeoxyribonuclease V alpha subunit